MAYNKYGGQPTYIDGVRFDSIAESRRYGELKNLERAGLITGLELQPKFAIAINGKHCFTWKGDFAYFEGNIRAVEDVKGFKTPMYRLKKKCVEAAYNITIREIGIQKKRKGRDVSAEVKEIFREAARRT